MDTFWILQRIFNHVLLDHGTDVNTGALRIIVDRQADVLDCHRRHHRALGTHLGCGNGLAHGAPKLRQNCEGKQ